MNNFSTELEALLNKHGIDNDCSTPDFILADMIVKFLVAYEAAMNRNIAWHGDWEK